MARLLLLLLLLLLLALLLLLSIVRGDSATSATGTLYATLEKHVAYYYLLQLPTTDYPKPSGACGGCGLLPAGREHSDGGGCALTP